MCTSLPAIAVNVVLTMTVTLCVEHYAERWQDEAGFPLRETLIRRRNSEQGEPCKICITTTAVY